jgi:deoxyribose-phosphate aldolase
MNLRELAALIDHTILKPEATLDQIRQLCREAQDNHFASVCINPVFVSTAARLLEGSEAKVCTVVGFPLGAVTTAIKGLEAREAIRLGAREIDMVIWVGGVKSRRWDWVEEDVVELARICRGENALLKVILECALLTDEEKKTACELCVRAEAHFVKTSTGFGPGGATVDDVRLMSETVKVKGLGVKAAGGIRSYAELMRMVDAGATRIGTSSGVKIMEEAKAAGISA